MTTTITRTLSKAKARALTDEVKADAVALWAKLLELYEGKAHKALGYKSWGAYFEAEFGQSGSHGYKLLNAAKVAPLITIDGNGEDVGPLIADTLAPVLKNEGEQAVKETYAKAQADHGPKPTAKQVKQTVQAKGEIEQAVIAKAGKGAAQRDIAKELGVPITTVAKIVQEERTAAKPKARTAKSMAPPTIDDLSTFAKVLLDHAKAASAAHAKFKKTHDLDDARTAGLAAAAAAMAAAAYQTALDKHLNQ